MEPKVVKNFPIANKKDQEITGHTVLMCMVKNHMTYYLRKYLNY